MSGTAPRYANRSTIAALICAWFASACGDGGASDGEGSSGTDASASGPTSADSTDSDADGTSGGNVPGCGENGWITYGHDARRTSTSDGCISGELVTLWGYSPVPPEGRDVQVLWHPLAEPDAAYLHWSATVPPYIGTSAADRIDLDGARMWTFDSGTDADDGDWGSLWGDRFVLQADGIIMLDKVSGTSVAGTGVDWWGQSIPSDGELLLSNTSKSDGPGLFVCAMDQQAAVLWKQNEQGTQCGDGLADQTGGIALDGSTLFYAPRYATGSAIQPTFASGVYAFDTTNAGAVLWEVASSPQSAISAADGLVYLVEQTPDGKTLLVARAQGDGAITWSAEVPGAGAQAPAIAAGKVLVGTSSGVLAFMAADGAPEWTVAMPAGYSAPKLESVGNGCSGTQPLGNLPSTAIAIAGGSETVVIAQASGVTVLSLTDGAMISQTTPDGVVGTLVNPIIVGDRVYVIETNYPASASRLVALQSQ